VKRDKGLEILRKFFSLMYDERFMKVAFKEALEGVINEEGGPFGAVVVIGKEIVGRGHNCVVKGTDPTAHAEMIAIRYATRKLGRIHLPDAVLYTTCEPCPMCLSAIYWARIPTVYFSMDSADADAIGFSDEMIYNEITSQREEREVIMKQYRHPGIPELMKEWQNRADRLYY
jgi:tRNA(Arg) A34 adenosine deaminase TadA